jgi:hypothetical protein
LAAASSAVWTAIYQMNNTCPDICQMILPTGCGAGLAQWTFVSAIAGHCRWQDARGKALPDGEDLLFID